MNIKIEKPKENHLVLFREDNDGVGKSDWVIFDFLIKKNINKTGLLFFLETRIDDFKFESKSGNVSEKFVFGQYKKPFRKGDVLTRKVRFLTPNEINHLTVRLNSVIEEELLEDKVYLVPNNV